MKILITGARGQVGSSLGRLTSARGLEAVALAREDLDVRDAAAVREAIQTHRPHLVVNTAAYTAVDDAEDNPEEAFAVNRDGPRHLALACAQCGAAMIHLSTDFVFDGSSPDAHDEFHDISPLGVYGESKWQGEQEVERHLPRHLILRVSWVFSSRGRNFVKTILERALQQEELRVVHDQRGCPTAALDIANTVLRLAREIERRHDMPWGTYHFCGTPATTWFDFAMAIVEEAERNMPMAVKRIVPIAASDYPTRAPRPANSVLDCQRLERAFGIAPAPWRTALERVVREIHDGYKSDDLVHS